MLPSCYVHVSNLTGVPQPTVVERLYNCLSWAPLSFPILAPFYASTFFPRTKIRYSWQDGDIFQRYFSSMIDSSTNDMTDSSFWYSYYTFPYLYYTRLSHLNLYKNLSLFIPSCCQSLIVVAFALFLESCQRCWRAQTKSCINYSFLLFLLFNVLR